MKFLDKDRGFKTPKILFCDSHILVAYKPPHMVVQIENSETESLEGYLQTYLKKHLQKETVFLRPIHRLDKPVAGLVVFAKSSKALKRLHEAQRTKSIEKFYLAKVSGSLKRRKGKLKHLMIHGDYRAEIVKKEGKEALLLYQLLKQEGQNSLLSIKLLTGRYHQIRAQLSEIGHPIVGDFKYGSQENFRKNQIALYHTKIILPHPTLKKKMVFKLRPTYF